MHFVRASTNLPLGEQVFCFFSLASPNKLFAIHPKLPDVLVGIVPNDLMALVYNPVSFCFQECPIDALHLPSLNVESGTVVRHRLTLGGVFYQLAPLLPRRRTMPLVETPQGVGPVHVIKTHVVLVLSNRDGILPPTQLPLKAALVTV